MARDLCTYSNQSPNENIEKLHDVWCWPRAQSPTNIATDIFLRERLAFWPALCASSAGLSISLSTVNAASSWSVHLITQLPSDWSSRASCCHGIRQASAFAPAPEPKTLARSTKGWMITSLTSARFCIDRLFAS